MARQVAAQTPYNSNHGFTITLDDTTTTIEDLPDETTVSTQDLEQDDSSSEQWFDV
tara:strand:+ start:419 stop:586 length:168 start_codon:yes stop_codon:yes gene_type:complete